MPLPKTGFYEIHHSNPSGASTLTLPQPILIPPDQDIRAHVMIVSDSSAFLGPANVASLASCYISDFVQNGVVQNGHFHFVFGHNITEIKLSADVNQGSVIGTLLIEYF
jgi:hypothetical protein